MLLTQAICPQKSNDLCGAERPIEFSARGPFPNHGNPKSIHNGQFRIIGNIDAFECYGGLTEAQGLVEFGFRLFAQVAARGAVQYQTSQDLFREKYQL